MADRGAMAVGAPELQLGIQLGILRLPGVTRAEAIMEGTAVAETAAAVAATAVVAAAAAAETEAAVSSCSHEEGSPTAL